MSERPSSPSTVSAPLTPAMPVPTLLGKRRSTAHDENGSSRNPIATSPTLATAATNTQTVTTLVHGGASRVSLRGKKASRPAEKPSIPFPTSSRPAPPVLTATHAGFADIANRLLNMSQSPAIPTSSRELGLGKRPRPSATRTKPTGEQKQAIAQATSPLWRTLEAKRKVVIAATLDYELLGSLPYAGSMVTPGMLREGLLTPDTAYHAWVGAKRAIEERPGGEWDLAAILKTALQYYLVELGALMLDSVNGPHYTFVDPRLHDNSRAMVKYAMRLTKLFAKKGYSRDRIVVTIPATEAGVQAAKTLERKHSVQTNLTLVSGLVHAAVCAEAEATCITLCYKELSEACGRKSTSSNPFVKAWETMLAPSKGLADEAIQATTAYFNLHKLQSAILVTNLRNVYDAKRLGEFDAVVFDAGQSLQARAPASGVLPATGPSAGTSATRQAHEAQYPTSFLASNNGAFLSEMPADARTVARVTLAEGLKDLTEQMFKTAMHMLEFLQGEAQLAQVDDIGLQAFYEEDEKEADRLAELNAAGLSAEPLIPVRWYDVGFRLRFSSWDQPAGFHTQDEVSECRVIERGGNWTQDRSDSRNPALPQ
ncbi:aldolase [Trametes punicea]|nr:aldolase [Trametes punicea]